jgi:hypothetical protein
MDFISLFLNKGFMKFTWDQGKNQLGVSVVATVTSWMYKGNHPKIIQDQIIPLHVLPSSGLKKPILVRGWDCKLDVFGVQICSWPYHASRLLLTMQIWV